VKQMRRVARRVALAALVLLALLASTLALFLFPPVVHVLLDVAKSAEALDIAASDAHSLSDALVRDLLVAGTFDVSLRGAPLLSPSERSHLMDVAVLFRMLLVAGSLALVVLVTLLFRVRRWFYQALYDGAHLLGIGAGLVGGALVVAFDATFSFAHQLLFPGGNWTFNPATDRLVQLYPMNFWLLAAVGYCVVLVAAAAFGRWIARRRYR
jgi:integral membrane protein (TIGR01906 family)